MDDELRETSERLKELIGKMPDGMTERLVARTTGALDSRQKAGATDDKRSTSTPAPER
ncbi:hypothetical protein O7632_10410 [Solwaraspora sp. WMMD406]|uniref:hypothetical protein n=1 Tax=Solwaraspora sp. WMMD406 TaxID=3016095 RepID=UPI002415AB7F|nr:hypothetical protein [Solwaraspora sp. WMMD406]MDG4764513.1 hypothetical protein [Solwaraspora sp. WMMD406]